MMASESLQELVGPYQVVTSYFSRVHSIAEITKDRSDDINLRANGYWASNFAIYGSEKKDDRWEPFILLGADGMLNPVQMSTKQAYDQFQKQEEYTPSQKELDAILSAEKEGKVLRISYHQLNHLGGLRPRMRIIDEKRDEQNSYLILDAERLINFRQDDYFNPEQRGFLQAVYGDPELQGKMMAEEGVPKTAICLVSEFYLEQLGRGRMIARTSWTNRKSHGFETSLAARIGKEVRIRGRLKE